MRPRARLLPAAPADLTDIAAWIATEAQSQRIALAFIARLRQRCDEIAGLPRMPGQQRDDMAPDLQSLARRASLILFGYAGEEAEVTGIVHGQRDLPAPSATAP